MPLGAPGSSPGASRPNVHVSQPSAWRVNPHWAVRSRPTVAALSRMSSPQPSHAPPSAAPARLHTITSRNLSFVRSSSGVTASKSDGAHTGMLI